MRIYVAAVEALRKNERQDETQVTYPPKLMVFLSLVPTQRNLVLSLEGQKLTLVPWAGSTLIIVFAEKRNIY